MKKNILGLFILVFSVCLQIDVLGQETVAIKRIATPIEFDGRPFEEAWDNLSKFPMKMVRPNFGEEPTEKTDVMMGYDDEYVWVGARLFMQDATKIVITSKKRDDININSDSFAVLFDSYNDNENALIFVTNPIGLRSDYTVSNDAAMGGSISSPFNNSWNTFWDVKTSMDDKGWYLEMRIPFSSLKFKPEGNITTMGLILRRSKSEKNEINTYPPLNPIYGTSVIVKPSMAATITFENIKPSNPVYISPYVISGFSRDWALNTDKSEYIKHDKLDINAGLDVKYNINSNLTLDLTANTDFAQVEADDQQVNLTRYSLYFPEKRMFFQERSSLFNFGLGGRSNLFYSRNIGLSQGNPVSIYGGARIAGRIGKWDMGLLNMQTEEYKTTPSENFGVFRMRRQVFNPFSNVGGIVTSRLGMNGNHNFAYGLDGSFRLFADDYLELKAAQTYDDKIDNKINSIDPMFLSARWVKRTQKGFAYDLLYSYTGQEFKPGIGFVNKPAIQGLSGSFLYGWFPGKDSKILNKEVNINVLRDARLTDGKMESLSVSPGFSISTKSGYQSSISINYQEEGVLFNFPLSKDVFVLSGDYSFTNASLSISTPAGKSFNTGINLNGGQFYDGQNYGFSIRPGYIISPSLQVSASYKFDKLIFPDRDIDLNIHIASARVLYMLSTKVSASMLVQYVNTTNNLISNFRFRYNPREGNDFYLVFNDFRGVSSNVEIIPAIPNYFNRTVLLKYTHTFIL